MAGAGTRGRGKSETTRRGKGPLSRYRHRRHHHLPEGGGFEQNAAKAASSFSKASSPSTACPSSSATARLELSVSTAWLHVPRPAATVGFSVSSACGNAGLAAPSLPPAALIWPGGGVGTFSPCSLSPAACASARVSRSRIATATSSLADACDAAVESLRCCSVRGFFFCFFDRLVFLGAPSMKERSSSTDRGSRWEKMARE